MKRLAMTRYRSGIRSRQYVYSLSNKTDCSLTEGTGVLTVA